MNRRFFAIAVCLLVFTLCANAVNINRYVKQGGTGRGTSWEDAAGSIQAAVEDCKKAGSGTIYIAAGTYNELVFLEYYTQDITIRGSYPAAGGTRQDYKNTPTIIDGTNQMACLAMHGAKNIIVDGIIARNGGKGQGGYKPGLSLNLVANGISALNSEVAITNCVAERCKGTGIGVDCSLSGSATIKNCVVRNCGEGIGLKSTEASNCEVSGCSGKGVFLYGGELSNSRIFGNKGVGVYVDHATLRNCEVFNNTHISTGYLDDGDGGGLRLSSYSTVENCLVYNNTATIGGGLYADYSEFTVRNSTFVNNKDTKGSGGLYLKECAYTLYGLVLWNNRTGNTPNQFLFESCRKGTLENSAVQGGGELPETDAEKRIVNLAAMNKADGKASPCFKNVTPFVGSSSSPETVTKIKAQNFMLLSGSACKGLGGLKSEAAPAPKPATPATTTAGRTAATKYGSTGSSDLDELGMKPGEAGRKVESKVESKPDQSAKVYDVVEQMPSFPGGNSELMQYLANNVKYPTVAEENGIQGRVLVTFIVERDGSITDVKVLRSVDPSLDKEAIRVLKSMPKWVPGKQNGSAVRVKYTVPVTFRL